jgi:hypothetical protein
MMSTVPLRRAAVNAQLIEAIRQLKLKPGESFTIEVDGQPFEICPRPVPPREVYEIQEMMMPWFDSPEPRGKTTICVTVGEPEKPVPYRLDESDLAPGTLDESHDLPSDHS